MNQNTRIPGLICGGIIATLLAGSSPASEWKTLQLDSWGTQRLSTDFHGFSGNNLDSLQRDHQTMLGVPLFIGESMIQLCSKRAPDFPDEVKGIEVDTSCTHLHFLQGTGWGSPGLDDGHRLGHYLVRYENDSTEEIPVVYGEDVRDWWKWDDLDTDPARIAWTGINDASAGFGEQPVALRLFLRTWTNPHPDRRISSLDFITLDETISAPFCIAITAEQRVSEEDAIQDLRAMKAMVNTNEQGHAVEVSLALRRANAETIEYLRALPQLRKLDFAANHLAEADWELVPALVQVHSLSLNRTNADDSALQHVSRLTKLESLGLNATQVSDEGVSQLNALRHLTRLDLSETQVSDQSVPVLSGMSKLRRLDLRDTPVTDEGRERLKAALPECRVK